MHTWLKTLQGLSSALRINVQNPVNSPHGLALTISSVSSCHLSHHQAGSALAAVVKAVSYQLRAQGRCSENACWVNEYLAFCHLLTQTQEPLAWTPLKRTCRMAWLALLSQLQLSQTAAWMLNHDPFQKASSLMRCASIRCWSFLNLSISRFSLEIINCELNFPKRKILPQNMPFSPCFLP